MSDVIMIRFEGMTPDQYDTLRGIVRWDTDAPEGMRLHVATFVDGVLCMTDVWDSAEQYAQFAQTRIGPGLAQAGIEGQPEASVGPVHELWLDSADDDTAGNKVVFQ
jgi:hypothetical protein